VAHTGPTMLENFGLGAAALVIFTGAALLYDAASTPDTNAFFRLLGAAVALAAHHRVWVDLWVNLTSTWFVAASRATSLREDSGDELGPWLGSLCPGLARCADVSDRWLSEEAAVFAIELRWAFVSNLESSAGRVEAAVQHQVSR